MRLKTYTLAALLALACSAGWGAAAQRAAAAPPKAKWEYQHREVGGRITDLTNTEMNLFGVNGWELIAVYNDGGKTVFIYKRPL